MKSSVHFIIPATIIMLFTLCNNSCAQYKMKKSAKHSKIIMKEKTSVGAVQQKIDSQLFQAVKENRGEKNANTNLEPAKVNADNNGNLKIDISGKISDALLNKIKALGGTIIYSSPQYNTVRAETNLSKIEAIAAFPEVTFISPAVMATTQPVKPVIN